MFPLDVAKLDLVFAHVAARPTCSSHLLQLLSPSTCAWVWRGCDWQARETMSQIEIERRGTQSGHRAHMKQAQQHVYMKEAWASGRPDASLSVSTLQLVLFSANICF